ncbi:MAG: hypothetical protein RLZZ352_861 [Pseudomonadota bacterium]
MMTERPAAAPMNAPVSAPALAAAHAPDTGPRRDTRQQDLASGCLFCVLGGGFAVGARGYEIGHATQMGPGYFPWVLGLCLVVLGGLILVQAFWRGVSGPNPAGRWAWRPLVLILGANLVFGVLLAGWPALGIPGFGLVVAVFALVCIASLAGGRFVLREVLVLCAVLAAGSYGVFVKLVGLALPMWPDFLLG